VELHLRSSSGRCCVIIASVGRCAAAGEDQAVNAAASASIRRSLMADSRKWLLDKVRRKTAGEK
jgi:hypothetical protein